MLFIDGLTSDQLRRWIRSQLLPNTTVAVSNDGNLQRTPSHRTPWTPTLDIEAKPAGAPIIAGGLRALPTALAYQRQGSSPLLVVLDDVTSGDAPRALHDRAFQAMSIIDAVRIADALIVPNTASALRLSQFGMNLPPLSVVSRPNVSARRSPERRTPRERVVTCEILSSGNPTRELATTAQALQFLATRFELTQLKEAHFKLYTDSPHLLAHARALVGEGGKDLRRASVIDLRSISDPHEALWADCIIIPPAPYDLYHPRLIDAIEGGVPFVADPSSGFYRPEITKRVVGFSAHLGNPPELAQAIEWTVLRANRSELVENCEATRRELVDPLPRVPIADLMTMLQQARPRRRELAHCWSDARHGLMRHDYKLVMESLVAAYNLSGEIAHGS